jgi:hypothetical protein
MERVNDWRFRKGVADFPNEVVAEKESVLKVDYIRPHRTKELAEVLGVKILVGGCAIQVVEFVSVCIDEVLIRVRAHGAEASTLVEASDRSNRRSAFSDENRFHVR